MNHLPTDAATARTIEAFALPASDTARRVWHASDTLAQYSFRSELSSTASLVVWSGGSKALREYETYLKATISTGEATSEGIPSLLVLHEEGGEDGGRSEPTAVARPNEAAIALLESWLAAPESDGADEELAAFIESIDENRLSERKLFP